MSPKILKNDPKIKISISLRVSRRSIRFKPCSNDKALNKSAVNRTLTWEWAVDHAGVPQAQQGCPAQKRAHRRGTR